MIKLLGKVEKKVCLALSGGADSVFALDFLRRGGREVLALYFNHNTKHAYEAESFVKDLCEKRGIPLIVGGLSCDLPKGASKEAFWREQRYGFFDSPMSNPKYISHDFNYADYSKCNIITSHHLDDAVETWIFSSLIGDPKLIPHQRGRYLRPFLLNKKKDILRYISEKNINFIQDPSNSDVSYRRNYIRHELMPHALNVNPGLYKTIKKKLIAAYDA